MNDKNGKRITKPRAKSMLCGAIARGYCNNFKSLKLDKIHEMMKEYGISRKSIHDTIVCNYFIKEEYREDFYKSIHNFCFNVLQNQ
jgi:hypothetical protein